jgi:allantoicase
VSHAPAASRPAFTDQFIDLAQPRLGARVLSATDEFFAAKERLIDPAPPVFIDGKYDEHGKWMDGWESRRKRTPGHDHCVIQLCPGVIRGFEIDTAFFTGNFPPQASIEACHSNGIPDANTPWEELVPRTDLQGNSKQYIQLDDGRSWTHLRFHIYPDGGVARLRVYGVAAFDWNTVSEGEHVDLLAMEHGGRALAANDMHYGHMSNLLAPGDGLNMGDGWETRRRREPGNDWVILKLGHSGCLHRILVDTAFFKGNYPARCSLHGALLEDVPDSEIRADADYWQPVLPPVELGPDQKHSFEKELLDAGRISHVRLDIYPDGGVSRLRLFGDWRCK